MTITREIEVGINSKLPHSISSTLICIRKIWGDFEAIFWEKLRAFLRDFFQKIIHFKKWLSQIFLESAYC